MKTKNFISAFCLLLTMGTASAVFTSCGEDDPASAPSLTLDKTSISVTKEAGTYSIAVTSNDAWTATSGAAWCTLSPTSGTSNGTITVNVTENTTTDSRSATITVTSGSLTQQVTVTQAASAAPDNNFTETGGGLSFDMIGVAGGTFTMGATAEQGSDAADHESPTHSVTLSGYAIGKYEVTQKLWWDVMGSWPGDAPSASYGEGDDYPMYNVSHDDIQSFLTALNTKTGRNYRLPTEAEWEYAARGGGESNGYKYSGSNTLGDVAWYSSNSSGTTHIVGTKAANELGIYDMSGNVWEWCSDWFGSYSSDSQTDPIGATTGSSRVARGGVWRYGATFCRVSDRVQNTPGGRGSNIGFRLVLPL
ncbi:serine/threonine kinase [Candidatus Symbiothrix dinenymphae]|nr:serine/threonine kinase [Candidatus Symbiothrix dinenymphae]